MNEGNACYDCHDLNSVNVEAGTSLLSAGKRNISSIRAAWAVVGNKDNSYNVPDEFGCLYCHNSPVLKDDPATSGVDESTDPVLGNRMRDASNHFRGKASAHPVGYDLTNGTDKSGHLLSSFDCKNGSGTYYGAANTGTNKCATIDDNTLATLYTPAALDGVGERSVELDCVDCHDVSKSTGFLGYPEHGKPLATNPLMLRAGVGGFNLALGEYDDVCRRCHGSSTGAGATGIASFKSTGKNLRLTVHQDASDVSTNVLKEYDGTLLKVADPNNDGVPEALTLSSQKKQCATCHATHYSSTNRKLFATGIDVANGSKCTDCHFPGDNNNLAEGGNFVKHGHGKAGIDFGCSSCHSVNADHDPTFPANGSKMFGFSPDTTPSKYNKDLTSICKTCHPPAQYTAHTGGGSDVGCIDCHDEHAEGVGTTSNNFMIPRYLPNIYPRTPGVNVELSFFQSDGTPTSVQPGVYDYYVDNANARKVTDMGAEASAGVCDNAICHVGITAGGIAISPLSTFMASGTHTGSNRTAGSSCSGCHSHTDTGGSWAANSSCTTCHGQPPLSTATSASGYIFYASNADESKTPHRRHVVDYGFSCKECHFMWTDGATHDVAGGSFESIWFDPARNPDAAAYPSTTGYTVGTYPTGSVCNNLYCHSDGQRHQAGGSVGTAQWMTGQQTPDWNAVNNDLPCNSCHGTGTTVNTLTYGAPDHENGTGGHTANSHAKHPYACAVCHNDTIKDTTSADGWTLATPLSANPHVDGSKSLKADGTTATFTNVGPVCSNISCHGGNGATWGGAALSCDQCHFRSTAGGGDLNNFALSDGTQSLINSDEWATSGHGRPSGPNYPSGNTEAMFASALTSDLKGCLYCHDGAVPHATATNPFRLRNTNALSQGLTAANAYGWNDVCLVCHSSLDADGFDPDGATANYAIRNGKNVDQNHSGSKHADASSGGTFCWDCHDPHGDTNQFMFQGPNGGSPGNGVTQVSAGSGSNYYGVPVTSRVVGPFDVTAGGGTPLNWNSADYVNASFTGLCQTCHTTAANYNQNTNTPLASHNGADATRCTSCHQHTNDFGSACDTCHGNPPLPRPTAGTTQTWVSDNAAGTQGDHTAHAVTYLISDCNNTCHISATHTTNKTTANMGVRAATAAASTGVHKYGTVDNVDVWTGNTAGITSVVDDSCVNVSCHNSTYGVPANAYKSAANPTYVRYWNNTFDCYSCHAYDGQADSTIRPGVQTSVAADWIATGSHDQHINRNGYALTCNNCHDTTGYTAARAALHGNGSVNFVTNFGAVRTGGVATLGVYDTNGSAGGWTQVAPFTPTSPAHTYFCGNVYCHSSGEPRGAAETITYQNTTPAQWGNATTGDCGYCHAVTGSVLATNVHEKHTGNTAGQYNSSCKSCHDTVVDATFAISSYALHVNGTNDVAFTATIGGTYSRTAGGTVGIAGGTCTATYCHSQGLDRSAPYTGTAPAYPAGQLADWDMSPGALACTGCHASPPNYANGATITPAATPLAKANSHAKHASFGCVECHSTTVSDNTTIASTTNHANQAFNVAGAAFTVGTVGSITDALYTPTTCNTITCHGNNNATWGATLTCYSCHAGTEAAATKPAVDAAPNPVNQAQYEAQGHGQAGAFPGSAVTGPGYLHTGSPAGCYQCHDEAAQHAPAASATDPFRLGIYAQNTNGLCAKAAGCHTTAETQAHTAALAGNNGIWPNSYDFKCVDCHDPHGDGNYYMIRSSISAPTAIGDTGANAFGSDNYGTPQDTANASPITFTSLIGNATNSYGVNTATNGICEVCHVDTTNVQFYRRNVVETNTHNTTGKCTSCHAHKDGFKASCTACHGDNASASWPQTATTARTGYPNRNGRHLVHMDALGLRRYAKSAAALSDVEQQAICGMCHNDATGVGGGGHYPASYTNADAPADLNNAASQPFDQMWGAYAADANGAYTAATYGASPTFAWTGASTCANVDCHNSQTTAATYEWYGAGTSSCLICHTKGGTNTATAAHPSSGLHNLTATNTTAHDESFHTGGTSTCTTCHLTASMVMSPSQTHINGASLASGDFSAANVWLNSGTGGTQIGTYTELTSGNSRGTCASTTSLLGTPPGGSCHSDGGRWAREWNSDANANHRTTQPVTNAVCTVCHGTLNNWAAGLTVNHNLTNINNGTHTNCEQCHVLPNAPYVWTTHHDMLETGVRYVETNSNASTGYAAATGNCNNMCHSNDAPHTMGGSTIWANLGLAGLGASCTGCHGYPPTSTGHAIGVTPVNHALLRAGGATVNANVTVVHGECDYCHGVRDNGTMDGFTALNPATLGGTYTYSLVAGVDHKDGSVTMNGGPGAGYVAASGWCTTAACHGADAAHSMASGAPTARLRNFGGGLCQTCHQTGTNGATVVPWNSANLHVNPAGATAPASEQCKACHTGHADAATPDVPQNAANKVEIRTRYAASTAVPTMNNQYSSHGYKIRLGGTSATGNTEAEMCWNCHATVGISEWGTNTKAATGSLTYNYGSVSAPNWTTATWSPASTIFNYKAAAFTSIHSVNFESGIADVTFTGTNVVATSRVGKYTETKDAVGNIRCTYCHDVHNTRPVGTGEAAGDVNGTPYLRGSWRGNPYAEDGAPFSSSTYTNAARYGAVPRGGTQFAQNGGYFIDQNTTAANTPAGRGWTAMQYGGLCEKCHANNDNVFSAAEISALDWKTGEGLWTSANGHANSVKDATGTGGANIFDFTHGRITPTNATGKTTANKYGQGLKSQTGSRGYGYRGTSSSGGGYLPVYQSATAFQSYNWGASVDAGTTQSLYHKFSCSKCHNPHASRLPKLLITNCLDINHNTWDNAKGSANTYYASSEDSTTGYNTDAYWMSAQNCHRASDSPAAKSRTPGWNKVSPWGGNW